MIGDGENQPIEGVDALDDLAEALSPKEDKEVQDEHAERAAADAEDEGEDEQQGEEESEEQDETEEETEEEEDDTTVKLKHDGKEVEVKLSEAINLAQQGLDYTKKTMAVAEERKAVEAERTQATEFRQKAETTYNDVIARLEIVSQFMESQVGGPPSVELLSTDATTYLIQKEQYEARKGQLQQVLTALESTRNEQARQRQASINARGEAAEKVLKDTLPGWNEATLKELAGYADSLGLTPQTAAEAMLEPGFWQLAHKAKAYDAIQAKKAQMKPTEKLTKVAKPGAQNQSGKAVDRAKREAAFNKNPSVDTLAGLL